MIIAKKCLSLAKRKETMEEVRILDITNITEEEVNAQLALLPAWRREKALQYKHFQGRKECVVSFLLLKEAVLNENEDENENYFFEFRQNDRMTCFLRNEDEDENELEFEYGEHGKPVLKGRPDIHFNISHCKKAVACVVADKPVGIDIECLGRYKESLAKAVLSDEEMMVVRQADEPDKAFTILWTKKEALLKCLGTGVSSDMKNVLAEHKDKKITTTVCDGYVYSVCTE